MKYEVRCCCRPDKLLGWLGWPAVATSIEFTLRGAVPCRFTPAGVVTAKDRIRLALKTVTHPDGRKYAVVNADGLPVETLRRVSGFVDANPDWIGLQELRRRVFTWINAHDGKRPERLHFRLEQWDRFRLERAALQHIEQTGPDEQTVFGIPVSLHRDLADVPHDRAPELWQ
jgi:hypothetical protein